MKLSVIIPTLNEQGYIKKTIKSLQDRCAFPEQMEIVVVDAGSSDRTVDIARPLDVQLFVRPAFKKLKYKSLNFGADRSSGDALLFLDADCTVPQDFDLKIDGVLNQAAVAGGAFEFKMEPSDTTNRIENWAFRLVELINQIRYCITKLYFGDQGVFCTKEAFDRIGGYPEKRIMESAYFCRLLKNQGKLKLIKTPLISSVRRFQNGGMLKVFWKDFWIWVQFWLGFDIDRYADRYWEENEKNATQP